jgi:hypothetical protein
MDPRANLVTVENRKISYHCQGSNPSFMAMQPVASLSLISRFHILVLLWRNEAHEKDITYLLRLVPLVELPLRTKAAFYLNY